jgi:hypothetical protein
MPLRLPNLDDLSWEDLIEEGRSLIPATAPEWTNHNVSDPGITLMELLAYISERLMYQLNRIPDEHMLKFLKLIQGPDSTWKHGQHLLEKGPDFKWKLEQYLREEKRLTVTALYQTVRAVTNEDFEQLAMQVPGVTRAVCIPQRNLETEDETTRESGAPGHVTVVVILDLGRQPGRELLYEVKQALEPARLLTTRVHVVAPRYLTVHFQLTIVPRYGVSADAVRGNVIERITDFFDPITGDIAKKGWPLGRAIHISELYQVLGSLDDVELVTASRDMNGERLDEMMLEPAETDRIRRNERGELQSIDLRTAELVDARITPEDLIIAVHA